MSVLFRARLSSFLAGVAVMGAYSTYQLKMHLVESQDILVKEVSICLMIRCRNGLKINEKGD